MIVNALDLGWRPPRSKVRVTQEMGNEVIEGSHEVVWARGGLQRLEQVTIWIQAWQALGGQPAFSAMALRYLRGQLRELFSVPEPVYIQWDASAQPNAPNQQPASDLVDGWYQVEDFSFDREIFYGTGLKALLTATLIAPATPSSLSLRYTGAALSSTYTGTATPLVAFPLGSSGQPPTVLSRTGGEGAVPLTLSPTPNPVPFVRPGTIAGLFAGGVRVFDTAVAGGNPVPTSGAFANASWVQVYGMQHDWVGDCVVTNGLLLLLFQVGQPQLCTVYVWNTSLGTPAWQQVMTPRYLDSVPAAATLREINLDGIGLEEAQVRVRAATSGGNWAEVRWQLQSGGYHAEFQFEPLTQANTGNFGFDVILANAGKIAYDEAAAHDMTLALDQTSVAPSAALGFGGVVSAQSNAPLLGVLYQSPPSVGQPSVSSSTEIGAGDSSGPAVATYRQYGIFAAPFGSNGASSEKLQAEAESGALGTGWASVSNANASNGNEAKAASGTASGNADLFGTAWQPPAGTYDVWFRVRVTSNAGSAAEMTLGLWDTTAGAFVAGGSATFRANQSVTTYGSNNWLKVNGTSPLTPTAGHNMQFRAATAAALGTDWFIDEAALVPIRSSTLGLGSFPGDIWSQFMFAADRALVRG